VTPLHVVAPWYLSWSQGWLKLADKTLVVGSIPLLMVAFIVMPYIEVGKSRRYADRRLSLSVAFLFIAFMLVSNWMGSPEFRVESSAEQEVAGEIMPQEGASVLKGVPYDELSPGVYLPGQTVSDKPYLTRALAEFGAAMDRHSCTLVGNSEFDECKDLGGGRYGNTFTDNAMPDPYAELKIEQVQEDMVKMILFFQVTDPADPSKFLIDNEIEDWRHEGSFYEEECRFFNKDC